MGLVDMETDVVSDTIDWEVIKVWKYFIDYLLTALLFGMFGK